MKKYTQEIWKDIEWYEWLYEISSLWSYRNKKSNKILLPNILKTGYSYAHFFINGLKPTARIHRLVAIHFIPNPDNLPYVLHKVETRDENWALYNWIDNLFWWTAKDNAVDCYRKWRQNNYLQLNNPYIWKFWKDHHSSKPITQYTKEWIFIREWDNARCVQRELLISQSNIHQCCKWNKQYSTVWWFIWKYL